MSERNKTRLTTEKVRRAKPPESGEYTLWDTDAPGLGVRCLPSGVKSYIVSYRAGYGRSGTSRRMTIGKVQGVRLHDARERAMDIRAQVLRGNDPVQLMKDEAKSAAQPSMSLDEALGRYDADQTRRGVVGRKSVQSALRRHLLGFSGNQQLRSLQRRDIVKAIEALEAKGLPGAAKGLHNHASTFLKWCADRGYADANPLHGYRASRATRAQRVAQHGRDLSDAELAAVWHGCSAKGVNPYYGALVRVLILTGQRRGETARMRWGDLRDSDALWCIPATVTKNGVEHDVPLPRLARGILDKIQPHDGCEFVFSTNGRSPISGWSKLDPKVRNAANEILADRQGVGAMPHWTLHDLRRTFRSGLSRLGVQADVAEIMLNHRPETLRAIYDRAPRMDARQDAAKRWADHLASITLGDQKQ